MSTERRLFPTLLSILALAAVTACSPPARGDSGGPAAPEYGQAFWSHWGDGRAELAGYDLTIPRYGESRTGNAVAIFVTEPFSAQSRVKAGGSRAAADVFQAIKLNLVKDFATGIYDYNTMLSAFVALESKAGVQAGAPVKLSFSSQEWCGHVYHQVLFDEGRVRSTSHSYFDGEADRDDTLDRPRGGLTEDGLYLWARGLAAPALAPGESRRVPLLLSLQRARLAHRELEWNTATLSRDAKLAEVTVPAGKFEVEVYRAQIENGPGWTFHVERAEPRRLVRWEVSDGERAELVAAERLPYWELQGKPDLKLLEKIGLSPRPARTP